MPKSRIILCLGFFIALLPVLGFPNSWDHFFDTASGLLIVLLSVLISVDRRLMLKAKAEKRTLRKRVLVSTPVAPEPVVEEPVFVPEPVIETPIEPVRIEEMIEPALPIVEPATPFAEPVAVRPRRRRRVNVVDGDVAVQPAEDNNIPQF